MKTVLTILGTRPEAIKLAPVLHELARRRDVFRSKVCVTGQHRELLEPMLEFFGIEPDYDLRVMRRNQPLAALTARLLGALDPVLAELRPDWIVIQGDTTSVLVFRPDVKAKMNGKIVTSATASRARIIRK